MFQKSINAKPQKKEKIILATVTLHNYLQQTDNVNDTPKSFGDSKDKSGEITEGQWRAEIDNNSLKKVNRIRNSPYSNSALQKREILSKYLMNVGSVPWQLQYIIRTGNE